MLNTLINPAPQKLKNQLGATAVEFAIILFLFILILFGIIEFGLLMYNQHVITNAGREGARFGIVFRDDRRSKSEIISKVNSYANNYTISFSDPNWNVDVSNLSNSTYNKCINSNDKLEVSLDFKYNFLFLNYSIDLNSTTIMICE